MAISAAQAFSKGNQEPYAPVILTANVEPRALANNQQSVPGGNQEPYAPIILAANVELPALANDQPSVPGGNQETDASVIPLSGEERSALTNDQPPIGETEQEMDTPTPSPLRDEPPAPANTSRPIEDGNQEMDTHTAPPAKEKPPRLSNDRQPIGDGNDLQDKMQSDMATIAPPDGCAPTLVEPDALAAKERLANVVVEAVRQCKEAMQLLERTNAKTQADAKKSGLLHFREWWELEEVNILVGGRLIAGIPIFVEEGALRVIDHNHSYFIPLEKVDYIRTNDGLSADLDAPDNRPIQKSEHNVTYDHIIE